ncbi:MAG: hypothetical protein KDA79_21720 [Planctomycetaceae bacterium]|nr:hypothetical protein [Planctomycetaceae bacterium]
MTLSVMLACSIAARPAADAAEPAPRFEFNRMIAHWANYGDPAYLDFVREARPQVAQFGFYGGHYWSLSHTASYKGYPAHFPVRGHQEAGDWFEEKNGQLHDLGVKVVGHMNVKFLVGDPEGEEGPRGFFDFYANHWDEKLLGPKPVEDPLTLLERKKDGSLITNSSYSIGGMKEYWACLNNPDWQDVLKAWTKAGIARGADGFIANYFYRHDCHCEHCVAGFKQHLKSRYPAEELKQKFSIDDLDAHEFDEIVAWHKPEESTPLRREMLAFSQIANKRAFDNVFLKYGRSLKPDLLAAQWNHLSNFSQISGDERCLLPADLWGKGESYLWYSLGASAFYTDLDQNYLGEGTLQARYIRGTFEDKPFTLGKYESTRIRVAIAELAANGGAPMGFYTRFTDPEARKEIARYYQFLAQHDDLYHASRSHAEAVLLYPRKQVHAGDIQPVARFRELGTALLNRHVLFDVLPNDLPGLEEELARRSYGTVIDPTAPAATAEISPSGLSRFEFPQTVRISASRPEQTDGLTVHLVNYNRIEPVGKDGKKTPKNGGRGIQDEKPIAVPGGTVSLVVPAGRQAKQVTFLTPEATEPVTLKFNQQQGRLSFEVPEFLVYGVTHIEWEPSAD